MLRSSPSFRQLTALFAGAVAATSAGFAVTQASGCGPCRAAYVEYEKLVPLAAEMETSEDTLAERCQTLCADTTSDRLDSCEDINVEGQDSLSCIYSIYADCGGIGRVPPGLVAARFDEPALSALGRYFARVAYLEAASVYAFRLLERELRAFGAPDALVARAVSAAHDEAHHTQLMAQLARRFGARPQKPRLSHQAVRSLEAIAEENAVEGCVRETFGALVAEWQARHAATREMRDVMRVIATDETRHAELAYAVHAWATEQLDPQTTARIEARARGIAQSHIDKPHEPDEGVARVAGFPGADVQRELARRLGRSLWRLAA